MNGDLAEEASRAWTRKKVCAGSRAGTLVFAISTIMALCEVGCTAVATYLMCALAVSKL